MQRPIKRYTNMSMIRRTCENTQITQFIIQQLLTLHSTLLKNFWRKNQLTKLSLFWTLDFHFFRGAD